MRKQVLFFHYWWQCAIFSVSFSLLVSCMKSNSENEALKKDKSEIKSTVPLEVNHAIGFSFEYYDSFKLLHTHNHYQENQDTLSYLLIDRKKEIPKEYKSYPVIYTPVKKVVLMTTTQIALFDALGALNTICGLSSADYLWNEQLTERVKTGEIVEVGRGANLNLETVLNLKPDVLIAVSSPEAREKTYSLLADVGIPVIYNAEWLENSILGRAEWVKVAAMLLNKENECNTFFNNSVSIYDSLKSLTQYIVKKPLIINNLPYRGTWYVPGGNSYVAELIQDAGGDYPWKNNSDAGSTIVSFEEIYEVGLEADIWLNPGLSQTLDDIMNTDNRLVNFKPFKSKKVYANTKRWHPEKGNDYWERGTVFPHLVLADLIHIMHPDVLPDHELYFYKKL